MDTSKSISCGCGCGCKYASPGKPAPAAPRIVLQKVLDCFPVKDGAPNFNIYRLLDLRAEIEESLKSHPNFPIDTVPNRK